VFFLVAAWYIDGEAIGTKQDAVVESLRAKGAPRKNFRDAKRRAQDDNPRSSINLAGVRSRIKVV
jgi:hypothetical protein